MSYLFVCMIASLSEDCDIKIYWKGLFFILYANSTVLAWLSCNALVSINVVTTSGPVSPGMGDCLPGKPSR